MFKEYNKQENADQLRRLAIEWFNSLEPCNQQILTDKYYVHNFRVRESLTGREIEKIYLNEKIIAKSIETNDSQENLKRMLVDLFDTILFEDLLKRFTWREIEGHIRQEALKRDVVLN